MTEKISREDKKQAKALSKARADIFRLSEQAANAETARQFVGDAITDKNIDAKKAEMQEIAESFGMSIDDMLNGKEATQSEGENKKAVAQANAETEILENSYRNTRSAIERSPDPYARAQLENTLLGIEERLRETAPKAGKAVEEVMAKLKGMDPEAMKSAGRIELEKLRAERVRHQTDLMYGDPSVRERFYEFEHKARKIIADYGLDHKHLEDFLVPVVAKDIEKTPASAIQETPASTEVRITETAQKEKVSFFKKLFGKKNEAVVQNSIFDSEKLPVGLTLKDEKFTETKKESLREKVARKFRNWSKALLFTGAAISGPIQTADTQFSNNPVEGKKIERSVPTPTVSDQHATPSKTASLDTFMATHARLAKTQQVKTPAKNLPSIKTAASATQYPRAQEEIGRLNLAELKQVRNDANEEMGGSRKLDTLEGEKEAPAFMAKANEDIAPYYEETPDRVPVQIAPEAMGVWSAGTPSTAPEQHTERGRIKVSYSDSKGNPLDTNAFKNTAEMGPLLASAAGTKNGFERTPVPGSKITVKKEARKTIGDVPSKLAPSQEVPADSAITRITTEGPSALPKPSAAVEHMQPITIDTTTVSSPLERTPEKEGWDWRIMRASPGYVLDPVDTPKSFQLEGKKEFQMRDPEIIVVDGYKIPHFLWERMDPEIWKALRLSPSAREIYLENVRHEEVHDPYTITLWNGDKGTSYIIAGNNMLAAPPQKRDRGSEALFGRLLVAAENTQAGKAVSINGRDANAYQKLSEGDKYLLSLTAATNEKRSFYDYSIDAQQALDGTVMKIDLKNDFKVGAESPLAIEREISDIIQYTRETRLVTERLQTVENHAEGGTKQLWGREYPVRPTREKTTIGQRTEKRILRKKSTKGSGQKTLLRNTKKKIDSRERAPRKEKFEVYFYK